MVAWRLFVSLFLTVPIFCASLFSAEQDRSELSKAILAKDVRKVEKLLNAGIDVEEASQASYNSKTPLVEAVEAGALEVVKLLVTKGADCNAIAKNHDAPLHYALWLCRGNSGSLKLATQIVDFLITNGADVEKETNSGTIPLCIAADINQPTLVNLLLHHHANIEGRSRNGDTALITAAKSRSLQVLQMLVKRESIDIEITNNAGRTAFIEAAIAGHSDVLKFLASHGANINAADNLGFTALIHVASMAKAQIVSTLLSLKVQLDCKTTKTAYFENPNTPSYMRSITPPLSYPAGLTAADLANKRGHENIAKMILAAQK